MKTRTIRSLAALCAPPLLASCMVRLEPSSKNDEFWSSDEEGSDVYGTYGGRVDPGPARVREPAPAPPLTSESDTAATDPVTLVPSDAYRELLVLDPRVLGPLSANTNPAAPFSFRAQMQWLAGDADALAFTRAWLLEWENTDAVGPSRAPVNPRPLVGSLLVDPWVLAGASPAPHGPAQLRAAELETAPYGADDADDADDSDVGDADDTELSGAPPTEPPAPAALPSWQDAPFVLIAIVNRLDLASDACDGAAGELRLVYGALDPYRAQPLDVTLIIEVPYPTTRSAAEWARAWQGLAALPPSSEYTQALARLGRDISTEADPLRARLRTNDIAFADADSNAWELREFKPTIRDGAVALVQAPLEFTPRADADPAALSAYVLEHASAIETTGASLPDELQAGAASIDTSDFSWNVLGVSDRLRRAFSLQTCNGCHGGDTATLPFRHIEPAAALDTPARLSRFLYDPRAPSDELRRRLDIVDALGATECAPPRPRPGPYGD